MCRSLPCVCRLLLIGLLICMQSASAAGLDKLLGDGATLPQRCSVPQTEVLQHVVISEIFPTVIHATPGRDFGSKQMFRPIRTVAAPLAQLGSNCLAGRQESCVQFSSWVQKLVDADALRFDRVKHASSPVSLVTGKLSGNLTLRPIALYTGILRDRRLIHFEDDRIVNAWLLRRALNYEHVPKVLTPAYAQNLVINSVVTGLTVGIAIGEPTRFIDSASQIYTLYLDTMRADGSLPEEAKRGASALKYSSMALGGMIVLAELSDTTGRNLYAYRASNGDIHTAIGFLASAIADETLIAGYARENFAPTDPPSPGNPPGQSRAFLRDGMSWSRIYLARFPDSAVGQLLVNVLPDIATPTAKYDETLGVVVACIWDQQVHARMGRS